MASEIMIYMYLGILAKNGATDIKLMPATRSVSAF
jgi:hypothetical protein